MTIMCIQWIKGQQWLFSFRQIYKVYYGKEVRINVSYTYFDTYITDVDHVYGTNR